MTCRAWSARKEYAMKRFSLVFLTLVAVCVLAACRPAKTSTTLAPQLVTSDDGLAQVTIPDGALPAGTQLSDLHVSKVTPKESAVARTAGAAYASYWLEPDGLKLQTPITFSLNVPGAAASLPLVWIVSDDKVETPPEIHLAVNAAAGKSVVSVQLSHFSQVVFAYGFFVASMSEPGTRGVREVFPVTVNISRTAGTGHVLTALSVDGVVMIPTISVLVNGAPSGPPEASFIRITSGNFALLQGIFFAQQPIVGPELIQNAPDRQPSAAGQVTVTRSFQCLQAGSGSITHNANVEYEQGYDLFPLPPGGINPDYQPPANTLKPVTEKTGTTKQAYTVSVGVKCVAETPTPSPTPRPSPTNSPSATPSATATPTPSGTSSVTPSPTPDKAPRVTQFVAQFVGSTRSTFYSVTATDPTGGNLSYRWSNTNRCGNFLAQDAPVVQWEHPDVPGGCPVEAVHPGTITVIITGAGGEVRCEYRNGSANGNIAQCVRTR
jgi:hypothetical protein